MTLITTSEDVAAVCSRLRQHAVVTVDTEFMREKTYYAQLCLVQLASPDEAVAIDPLAPDIELGPLFELMADPSVLKVFHAARQDLEIFWHLMHQVPAPLFDTQIAASVLGYGDNVGYEALVNKVAGAQLDKASRFTDWAIRPLSERQITYALGDVTHLRDIHAHFAAELERQQRESWLAQELAILGDAATYRNDPRESWRRLKARTNKPKFLAVLREVAAWREAEAQRRDLPRARVVRDDSLLDIAGQAPTTEGELARIRGLGGGFAGGKHGKGVLEAIQTALASPPETWPKLPEKPAGNQPSGPLMELLKVLLKTLADDAGVAPRMVVNAADLERLAIEDAPEIPAMTGWRYELFGAAALELKRGVLSLSYDGHRVVIRRT